MPSEFASQIALGVARPLWYCGYDARPNWCSVSYEISELGKIGIFPFNSHSGCAADVTRDEVSLRKSMQR